MTRESCSLHVTHSPVNLTVEDHHIIPQAWQKFWWPQSPGTGWQKPGDLWDVRTAPCCPTGHRNVHALLVEIMHALASEGTEDIIAAIKASGVRQTTQRAMAVLALERWQAARGHLLDLTGHHEWGEA
jgi:hypothetical protein